MVKKKKELLIKGPSIKQTQHVKAFKKKHKKTFIKSSRVYVKKKINFSLKKFLQDYVKQHKRQLRDMYINGFSVY